jgi:hypothetical protein
MFDVYLEATGLLHEAECEQDEEEREQLRQKGVTIGPPPSANQGLLDGERVGRSSCWRPLWREFERLEMHKKGRGDGQQK